ncbi:MAG: Plug domain-containing protein, partial [Treponema sp.]|nr:Plug domain-containing protein [Treponema sp.]
MKKEEGGRLNELRALSRIKKICVLVLFLLPAALFARDIEIYVEDEELGLPLEGAVVALRNGRQYVCGEDGVASFSIVDERQQVVQITYPGYDTRRVTIPAGTDGDRVLRIIAAMQLSGVMQGRELVVEAQRPEVSETKSGRSVAISERELAQTAEIGLIEDVMSSVKLLPGVGYTGMFGAMPSIRGGDPGDLMASFDGFYLERPYHWVGAVSIFDPKMVSSARLSHGVFSSRYGHTVSGLLEIASKSPSATEVELETSISTSAVSFNLSYPLG